MPTSQELHFPQTEEITPKTHQDDATNSTKKTTLIEAKAQLDEQIQRAKSHYEEIQSRTGSAQDRPNLVATTDALTETEIHNQNQQLRHYISKTNTEIAVLNARVDNRQKSPLKGDLIRIFLSEATVNGDKSTFKAQPLVGQWIRGESRVIRLKDNLLFESPLSEDLQITFSEKYQLIINDQVISVINPNKAKNSASFEVPTHSKQGTVVGKLDYRIIEE
ncbi:hypothetical protein HGG82_04660 [Marinomonas sp. M1K-6]|uniref:Uncharacterized protein n=1 Tax=Marinomonas profundi TaxID=2726122 RepID=A0A847R0E6_9GAMM|nr:hypothetical protein [Marinomonas profundi]NLQ16912.1 hypothetical protein [Marinomonas profundi]UDV02643.1 hypothetical protein J8N69_13750 [Marinomonas profundi]